MPVPKKRTTSTGFRYNRYEAQVVEGLTEMFVAGVSTQKVGAVAQTLMGVAPRLARGLHCPVQGRLLAGDQ